jgi:hypothetical protein
MALTIVEEARSVTGGVDTHAGTHVAAALDPVGGLLGVREFPATAAGYSRALVLTGPDDLRTRFARHTPAALITGLASLRPRTGDVAGHATASRCASWGGAPGSWTASSSAWTSS